MNPVTITDMLGAIDKGIHFYKAAIMNDMREVIERDRHTLAIKEVIDILKIVRYYGGKEIKRDRHTLAIKEVIDILKIVRHYGGKEKVAELLGIQLNKQQPTLFGDFEPLQGTIVTNFEDFVSEQNNRSVS